MFCGKNICDEHCRKRIRRRGAPQQRPTVTSVAGLSGKRNPFGAGSRGPSANRAPIDRSGTGDAGAVWRRLGRKALACVAKRDTISAGIAD